MYMFCQLKVNLRGTGEVSQRECGYKQAGGETAAVTKDRKDKRRGGKNHVIN